VSLRVLKQFSWLKASSGKVALVRPIHQQVTQAVNCTDMYYLSNHQTIAEFSRIFEDSSLHKCNGYHCSWHRPLGNSMQASE
jgi:hypothetical protein